MRRDKDRAPTKGQADNPIYIKYLRLEKLPCLRDKVSGFELTRGPGWQPNIAVDEPQPGQQSLRSPLLQQLRGHDPQVQIGGPIHDLFNPASAGVAAVRRVSVAGR